MAPNQLTIEPIRKAPHVQITWGDWFWGFRPVGVIPLFGTPGWPTRCNLPGMNMTAADLALSMTPGMMGIITPCATGPGPSLRRQRLFAGGGFLRLGAAFAAVSLIVFLGVRLPWLLWVE